MESTPDPTILANVQECSACPNLGEQHTPSYGDPNAKIMIVGEHPYEADFTDDEPFKGIEGEPLDFMLDEIFHDRSQVYLAYLAKCFAARRYTDEEYKTCFNTWLKQEILSVKPRVCVLMGRRVWKIMPKKMEPSHGKIVKTKRSTFIFWESPVYFLKKRDMRGFLALAQEIMNVLEQ